jgi:tellurite methyltransferase
MSENTWNTYFERIKENPPRPLLVEALNFVKEKNEAIDLGSGALNDVRYLVSQGFNHVTAVDQEPLAKDIINEFPESTVDYRISTFEEFDFKDNRYDLVNAQFSLPFIAQENFSEIFGKIISSLKLEGIIAGQFLGTNDEWNKEDKTMSFHSIEEANSLLNELEVIKLEEKEYDKNTAAGDLKHWHVINFIARKNI